MRRRQEKRKHGNLAVVNSVPGEKVVMAHSLGNMVVSSAFADHGMVADKYFALNAAVASEAFDSSLFDTKTNNPLVHTEWHEYQPKTWSACWHELFTSGDDRRELTWKDRFGAVAPKVYNYWSSGDEVLEIGPAGLALTDGITVENLRLQARQSTWHKQELFKGRNILYGSGWAGWGFESNVVASAANAAPDAVLRTVPIFEHDPSGMFSGSIPQPLQNHILAKGIPALSAPVGRTNLADKAKGGNFDMNAMKPQDGLWCRRHDYYKTRWLHSDIQDVGYIFSREVFDSFVREGNLK